MLDLIYNETTIQYHEEPEQVAPQRLVLNPTCGVSVRVGIISIFAVVSSCSGPCGLRPSERVFEGVSYSHSLEGAEEGIKELGSSKYDKVAYPGADLIVVVPCFLSPPALAQL